MQFVPGSDGDEFHGARGGQADITFCLYTEPDPAVWDNNCLGVVEEYVTCLGVKELMIAGDTRAEITALVVGIGKKYNIADDMQDLLESRIATLSGMHQAEAISPHERAMIDTISSATISTSFMARLRLFALESIKERDVSEYEKKKALWLQNYERIKHIFEKRTVKILSPPVFLCITPDYSQTSASMKTIHDRTAEQLNHMYRDLYFVNTSGEGGYQKTSFLQRWLADDKKKTFATCIFDPKGTIPGNFNTFFGFRAETIPSAVNLLEANNHLHLILTHIKEVFCNSVDNHAEYFLKWLANIVKYPWKKTEVLILIFGVEGCGKGMIIDFFANKVLGQQLSFQTATPGVDLFSKFAVGAHRKLLCFCDEAGEDLSKHHDQLKNLITTKTIRVEKKGQDIRTEDNYTNVIVVSNNAGPVRISPHDRRVVAFECDEKYKENYGYFTALAEATNNEECAKLMYEYLLNYNVPLDYNFQAFRPITKYYESLQAASLPVFYRFLSFKCITQGSETAVTKFQARSLFNEFIEWKNDRNYEFAYTESRFGRDINELSSADGAGVTKVKRNTICYDVRFDQLRQFLIRRKRFDENAF
jgi:hypothetical protein